MKLTDEQLDQMANIFKFKALRERYKIRRRYKKYVIMKKSGKSDREVYLAAKADGFNTLEFFEILCCVCGLSYEDAKELMLCTNSGVKSLSE